MASNLIVMASNLIAMASHKIALGLGASYGFEGLVILLPVLAIKRWM